MSLPLLGALVVGGILGVIVLVHSFGWTGGLGFADEDEARKAFARDYADCRVDRVMLSDDRTMAILSTDRGAGIVARFGRGTLTRHLMPDDLRRIGEAPDGLRLYLHDDSAPRLHIALSDADMRKSATAILKSASEA